MTWWVLLLGIIGNALVILGVTIFGARAVTKSFEHNMHTCECNRCHRIRAKAWNKLHLEHDNREWSGAIVSTAELRKRDVIMGDNGGRYRVTLLSPRGYGVSVVLTNLTTGNTSWIFVTNDQLDTKRWRLSDPADGKAIGI